MRLNTERIFGIGRHPWTTSRRLHASLLKLADMGISHIPDLLAPGPLSRIMVWTFRVCRTRTIPYVSFFDTSFSCGLSLPKHVAGIHNDGRPNIQSHLVDARLRENSFVSVGSVIRPNQREIYLFGKTTDED
jgi:hypothetical protein